MKINTILLTAVLLWTASAAAAADPAPVAAAAPAKPESKLNRVVCRTDDEIGTRVAKRKICMTVAQWREVGKQSGDWLDHRTGTLAKPGGG